MASFSYENNMQHIDTILVSYLQLVQKQIQLRFLLNQILSKGFMQLTSARFSLYSERIGGGEISISKVKEIHPWSFLDNNSMKLISFPDKVDYSWLSIFKPPQLKSAEDNFKKSLQIIIEMAQINIELKNFEKEYNILLLKKKQYLLKQSELTVKEHSIQSNFLKQFTSQTKYLEDIISHLSVSLSKSPLNKYKSQYLSLKSSLNKIINEINIENSSLIIQEKLINQKQSEKQLLLSSLSSFQHINKLNSSLINKTKSIIETDISPHSLDS